MIVLFTVLRLLAILIVSHDMYSKLGRVNAGLSQGVSCSLYLLEALQGRS